MSIKIRLARGGRKGKPFYKIVVTDSRSPRDGRFIEKIGTYDPLLDDKNEKKVTLEKERAEYWLGTGAKPSDRVSGLLCSLGIKGAEKYKVEFTPKKKGDGAKKKAVEAAKAKAEAKKEKEEAAKAAAEEAKNAPAPEAEVKTEEVKADTPTEEAKPVKEEVKADTPKEEAKPAKEVKAEAPKEEAKPAN